MAAILPYPRISMLRQETATEVITHNNKMIQTFFPLAAYDGLNMPKVAAFFITTSAGNKTLILADALQFVGLCNSCDPMRELLPVTFDSCPRNCSAELTLAIRDHGYIVGGSPRLIALQIEADVRSSFSKFFSPSYQGTDPHAILASIIRGEVPEGYVGEFCIRKIPDGWVPPAGNPIWGGVSFEQEDRLIRTWIHEANPNALQRARDEAQRLIDQTNVALARKNAEIQRQRAAGRYQGAVKKRLDKEREDINSTLLEHQNHHVYLTAQTVNSASHTTLQCAIKIQVDDVEKIRLLERYVCQQIVSVIDRSLQRVSWQTLQIAAGAIENFIRQKINALEQKLPVLVANNERINLTDWVYFQDEVFPQKQAWVRQTFENFCQEQIGRPNPTAGELPGLQAQWQEGLSEKLIWVTARLRAADDELKVIEHDSFIDIDIQLFDAHRQRMVQVLRQSRELTYGLGLELDERYSERDRIRNAIRGHTWVHLVKRVTSDSLVYFGVTNPPNNPSDRPDPNDSLNEVHVPVINVQNPFQIDINSQPVRGGQLQYRQWEWLAAGVVLFLGVWIARRYYSSQTSSDKTVQADPTGSH